MKLNLLPTYVSKGKNAPVAIVFALLIIVACGVMTVSMMSTSKAQVEKWTKKADEVKPIADAAVSVSQYADKVIANSQGVILDASLAKAMIEHNTVYPDFYDKLMPYIPSFFRITSMTASPIDDKTCAVTLSGVIETQEQYANLMLAFNRVPQVQSVARSGYTITEQYVPGLTEVDQAGRIILRGDQRIPDDPIARMNYYIAKGSLSSYSGAGGFGSGQTGVMGPMPKWSPITIAIIMPGKLQTPNPRATLMAGAGGGGATGGPGAAAAPAGPGSGQKTGGGGAPAGPSSAPGTAGLNPNDPVRR